MVRTSQIAQVGRRKVELSNLKKVLWPDDGFVKAELIEYYLQMAPTILSHVRGRLLTLVRFPDGIDGQTFFQKRRPRWAPEWIDYVSLGGEGKAIDYMLLTEAASLVWLANLACIELHQTHYRKPRYDNPDYFVFDLDPPNGYPFTEVVAIALELREHLEGFGYHPFVKTTGRKGLHVVVPIEPAYTFEQIFTAVRAMAGPFVSARSDRTTLHIKKESRKGRVLIDIYRNRQFQTIVSPYSVRGLAGAPVSTPLEWDYLASLQDHRELNIHTVPDRVIREGDPWQAIGAYAVTLHTERKNRPRKKTPDPSQKYKTPEQLKSYEKKRRFSRTPEPAPAAVAPDTGHGFVVHRHHASRLHYDLRLEQDGTLKSWALPRGLPPRPGIKRLAILTEDHPVEYLTFEGTIPRGEYGGGDMWIFASGRYEITKQKKDGFYFRLQSRELNGEYRTYKMKGNEWLLERLDEPQVDWLQDPIEPMLAQMRKEVPQAGDYLYEIKWDGIRAMISLEEGTLRIRSRSQRDITAQFPELNIADQAFRASGALFDAEIVCLDAMGRPVFGDVISRLHDGAIERGAKRHPAVCYVFDCLYLDGRPLTGDTLLRRREWMADAIKKNTPYRVSEALEDGAALFDAAAGMGLEGIMAKEAGGRYFPGRRSSQWLKIKSRQTADCVIVGYTKGRGDRASTFGALQLAEYDEDSLRYRGKVGTGFDGRTLKNVLMELKKVNETKRPVKVKPVDDAVTVWLEPRLLCEVQYASVTGAGTFREPVFLRMRPDLMPD